MSLSQRRGSDGVNGDSPFTPDGFNFKVISWLLLTLLNQEVFASFCARQLASLLATSLAFCSRFGQGGGCTECNRITVSNQGRWHDFDHDISPYPKVWKTSLDTISDVSRVDFSTRRTYWQNLSVIQQSDCNNNNNNNVKVIFYFCIL